MLKIDITDYLVCISLWNGFSFYPSFKFLNREFSKENWLIELAWIGNLLLITRHHSFVWLIISEPLFACYYCIRKLGKGLLRWKCSLCNALPMGRKHSRICQTKDCNPRASDPAQHCLSPQTATVLCHSLCLENKLAVSPGVCVQRTRMWRAFLRSNSSDLTTIISLPSWKIPHEVR